MFAKQTRQIREEKEKESKIQTNPTIFLWVQNADDKFTAICPDNAFILCWHLNGDKNVKFNN